MRAKRVVLFNCEPLRGRTLVREIKKMGYLGDCRAVSPQALLALRQKPPAAIIIDLSRAPGRGRDIGIYIRHHKATRNIPIVFVNGTPEKVAAIREHLPDAVYAEWDGIRSALKQAIARPPLNPCAPKSLLAGYSGRPLVKKLGIKPGSVVIFINAPCDFEDFLVDLPERVVIETRVKKNNDLIIWFVQAEKDMRQRIKKITPKVGHGGIWVAWPKKTSDMISDLSQKIVRDVGLGAGLVDYKVCSIDETWAGLKFARRK